MSSSIITFAANNEHFRKRKRVYRACAVCKKRRKRCDHTFEESEKSNATEAIEAENDDPSSPQSTHDKDPSVSENDRAMPAEGSTEQEPARFLGYLNPEAIFRGPAPEDKKLNSNQHRCGYWISAERDPPTKWPRRSKEQKAQLDRDVVRLPPEEASVIDEARRVYLDAIGVSMIPPKRHEDALIDVYLSSIHPILPILDLRTFERQYKDGHSSKMLRQAICIIASKHDRARDHLYLPHNTARIPPRDFANRLYVSVVASLDARLEKDRMVLIQVLALLSLHSEGSDGAEQASMHLAQAIHHAHTFGLHFNRKEYHPRNESLEKLFWCLWSLDKMNGTINGRPHFMHNRDNWLESPITNSALRHTPFGVWLQISAALDKITHWYRPTADPDDTGWELGFPGFEEILSDGGEEMDSSIVAVLELYYHATSMVSYKSKSINDPVRSTPSQTRQSLSAVRVISILSSEAPDNLPPLPVIPYALSLAMTTAYRQFRQSKLVSHKKRAKEDLKTCCSLLGKMRVCWWSAGAMADLGCAALSKADGQTKPSQSSPVKRKFEAYAPIATPNSTETELGVGESGIAEHHQALSNGSPTYQHGMPNAVLTEKRAPNDELASPTEGSNVSRQPSLLGGLSLTESPDWMNFDNAFENLDALLGSSGPDLSNELLRPINSNNLWSFDPAL